MHYNYDKEPQELTSLHWYFKCSDSDILKFGTLVSVWCFWRLGAYNLRGLRILSVGVQRLTVQAAGHVQVLGSRV